MLVPTPFLDIVHRLLDDVSPYVRELRYVASTVPSNVPLTIELQCTHPGIRELAAIVHVANIQELRPRTILIHRNGPFGPKKVSILSSEYKPL